jgi:phage host-nuclease inhibitor protein Gam
MDEDLKLVERLRQKATDLRLGDYYRSGGVGKSAVVADEKARIFEEAAEAITRLRAEITQMTNTIDGLEFQRNEALSEIGRLKSDAAAVMPPCG